jgi:hypothetical protein
VENHCVFCHGIKQRSAKSRTVDVRAVQHFLIEDHDFGEAVVFTVLTLYADQVAD